jgi:PAS domain-containing protein
MMRNAFTDYRCSCGKLLFKGLLITGGLEVKCRFCKQIQTIQCIGSKDKNKDQYIIVTDQSGNITEATSTLFNLTGNTQEEILSKNIKDILIIMDEEFYPHAWDFLVNKNNTIILFQTMTKNKDLSLTPVQTEIRKINTEDSKGLIFIIERKRKYISSIFEEKLKTTNASHFF